MIKKTFGLAALAAVTFAGVAEARDQINIVGSSTVYPFATVVAEQFGKTSGFKTPKIRSTGSGGGLNCSALVSASNTRTSPMLRAASRRPKSRNAPRMALQKWWNQDRL